jgi:hypothetical protein
VSALPDLEKECFFIAPIGPDGSEQRSRSDTVLEFIVARAAAELGLAAVRADQLAEPGQITLQVIEHVLGSKTAVVDLTGRNPNVYYELAIRHTAKLPTVLICEQGEDLPFDIAQMRTIFFCHNDLRSADYCRTEITRQLGQALEGAVDSPVTASIDLQNLQAGNAVERNVAELVTTVSKLEKALHDVSGEVRIARRHADLNRVWQDNMVRQQAITHELNQRLNTLLSLASARKDTELESSILHALEMATALSLSFPTGFSRRTTGDLGATPERSSRHSVDPLFETGLLSEPPD